MTTAEAKKRILRSLVAMLDDGHANEFLYQDEASSDLGPDDRVKSMNAKDELVAEFTRRAARKEPT